MPAKPAAEPWACDVARCQRASTVQDLSVRLELRSFPALGATPCGVQIFDFPIPAGLARQMRAALNPDGTATAAPPMFAELHLLEGAVATSALDADARARLVTRLKALQWKLEATEPAAGDNKLTAGTDDDIFDVINKELGLT